MAKNSKSIKAIQINKASATVVLGVSLAAVVVAFSLVGCKVLLEQRAFQSRVISQQKTSLKIAKADIKEARNLSAAYNNFNEKDTNIIGGSKIGAGAQDGTNTKIILDALPSQYDFPALITSLDSLLTKRGFKAGGITGTDDTSQQDKPASATPIAVPIPFQLSASGSYNSVKDLVTALDHTILPVAFDTMQLTGTDSTLSITGTAKTYYQPAKTLNITSKVVK